MDRHIPVPHPVPTMAPMPMPTMPMMGSMGAMPYSMPMTTAMPTYGATTYGGYGAATTYGASYPATTSVAAPAVGTPIA